MSPRTLKFALIVLVECFLSSVAIADSTIPSARLQAAIERLDKLASETLQSTGVPGIAIAIVHGDEVVFKKGYGVREVGKPQPIDADTVFQVASVSKPITSTVLARLVGEGKIGWDDRVIDHDPGFRMHEPYVTRELRLRDLLCHRSGLPDHCGDLLEDLGYDRPEILQRLQFQPPSSSFRAGYAYTNFGFSEAAFAAAMACNETWEDLAAKKLFAPLGMTNTSYRFADYAKAKNRALLHVKQDGKWIAKHTRQPDAQAPAGGASSTLNDLVKWLRLHLADGQFDGQQLIAKAALAETRTPQMLLNFVPEQGRVSAYGLGWNVGVERGGRVFWRHSGGFSLGMRTEVSILPSEKLAIAVLSNAGPTGLPEGLTESFFDLAIEGESSRDWIEFANRMFAEQAAKELGEQADYTHPPKQVMPPLDSKAYVGKYANDFFGAIQVAEKDGKLVVQMGPKRLPFELTHWDRDAFVYQPQGESADGLSGVRFLIDSRGTADRVLIENLNIHGLGTFERVK